MLGLNYILNITDWFPQYLEDEVNEILEFFNLKDYEEDCWEDIKHTFNISIKSTEDIGENFFIYCIYSGLCSFINYKYNYNLELDYYINGSLGSEFLIMNKSNKYINIKDISDFKFFYLHEYILDEENIEDLYNANILKNIVNIDILKDKKSIIKDFNNIKNEQ